MLYIKTSSGTSQLTLDKDYQSFKTSVESSLYFKPSEILNIRGVSCGWFTTNGTSLVFDVPLSKSLEQITKGTILAAQLIVRQDGKYAIGSATAYETLNLKTDNPGVVIDTGGAKGSVGIRFTFPNTRAVTNNDACGVDYVLKLQLI